MVMCVCVCVCGETLDYGEYDKIMKISGKVDKSDTHKGSHSNISFFIQEFRQTYIVSSD